MEEVLYGRYLVLSYRPFDANPDVLPPLFSRQNVIVDVEYVKNVGKCEGK